MKIAKTVHELCAHYKLNYDTLTPSGKIFWDIEFKDFPMYEEYENDAEFFTTQLETPKQDAIRFLNR